MSSPHPQSPNLTCSCPSALEVKRLKKQLGQLTEEIDELKRDKRSFRDASDEYRRNLAKSREETKELKKKGEIERQEKEEYAEMVRKLKEAAQEAFISRGEANMDARVERNPPERNSASAGHPNTQNGPHAPLANRIEYREERASAQPDGHLAKRKSSTVEELGPPLSKKTKLPSSETINSSNTSCENLFEGLSRSPTASHQNSSVSPTVSFTGRDSLASSSGSVSDPRLRTKRANNAQERSTPHTFSTRCPVSNATPQGSSTGTTNPRLEGSADLGDDATQDTAFTPNGFLEQFRFGESSLLTHAAKDSVVQPPRTRGQSPNKKRHSQSKENERQPHGLPSRPPSPVKFQTREEYRKSQSPVALRGAREGSNCSSGQRAGTPSTHWRPDQDARPLNQDPRHRVYGRR